ncbi:MAG TPA: glycosyltransferase family 2 protein [Rhizomicrobium sp.]|jgi:glycosyltransferase involved in cell wall biosynthesis|nr:glycosyltransferase family 2 protein [Rhizomicrobium sp.]
MISPLISAAICTYNRYDLLPKAIASLRRQSLATDEFEIIVVDNSPDRRKSETFSRNYAGISNLRWIVEATPGLSNARNVAARMARSPLIAFMDDDAVAASDWLEELLAAFEEFGPEAKLVGGRVDPIWGVPRPDWLPDDLLGYVSVVNWGGVTRFASDSEWIAGTNLALRVEALVEAGGFSVKLGRTRGGEALLSNDESEVVARIRERGGRLVYSPAAVVEHLVPAERLSQGWFRRRAAWQAVSDYIQDPASAFGNAPRFWRGVTEYYARLPPRHRTPAGLHLDQTDPGMFRMQMSAVYNYTIALLSGFHGIGP